MIPSTFSYLHDAYGAVILGWLEPSVLYAQFERRVSAELGIRFAAHFDSTVGESHSIRYFADSEDLDSYDLVARATIVDAVLSKRRQFELLVARPRNGITELKAAAFARAFGCVEYVTAANEFDARLQTLAPSAFAQLIEFRESLRSARHRCFSLLPEDAIQQ